MPVDLLLDHFRQRVPWSAMKAILKMCNLPVGQGWDNTIKKLLTEEQIKNDLKDNFAQLAEWYCNHLLVGEKAIKLFCADRKRIDELINSLQTHEPEITIFHETFPFPLSTERLEDLKDRTPKLIQVREFSNSLALIFCTKRRFTERTELNSENLSPETQRELNYYDKIIGIREYNRQFFDVVVLWKEKELVEVRIDIVKGMNSKERTKAFNQIIMHFNELETGLSGLHNLLKETVNLFPLVDNLYNADEGKVVEIGFTTDEGSIKLEKMRRSHIDLRIETYHKAGKEAVHHITPYRLAVLWNCPISSEIETYPELFLPGQTHTLSEEEQYIEEALVTKCSGLTDYNFILEKINTYLNDGS